MILIHNVHRNSLDRTNERHVDVSQSQPNSYSALLRTFGLQAFSLHILATTTNENRWPWKLNIRRVKDEDQKSVIQHDRRVAVLRSLIHVISLLGCIALITINSMTWYCGPSFPWSSAL